MKNIKPLYLLWGVILLIVSIFSFNLLLDGGYGIVSVVTFGLGLVIFLNILIAFGFIKANSTTIFSQILIAIAIFLVWLTTNFPVELSDGKVVVKFFFTTLLILFIIAPIFFVVGVIVMLASLLREK